MSELHGLEYSPEQLLAAKHDTPDQTGELLEWEPVNERDG